MHGLGSVGIAVGVGGGRHGCSYLHAAAAMQLRGMLRILKVAIHTTLVVFQFS